MPGPTMRAVGWATTRIISALVVYLATAFIISSYGGSAIVATMGASATTVPVYVLLHALPVSGARAPRAIAKTVSRTTWSIAHPIRSLLRLPRHIVRTVLPHSPWLWLTLGVLVFITSQVTVLFLADLIPSLGAAYVEKSAASASVSVLSMATLAIVIAPIAEETLMRGVVYREMRYTARLPLSLCVIASAVMFASFHGSLLHGVGTFLLGWFLALVYEYSGSLLPSITLHALYNIGALLLPSSIMYPLVTPEIVGILALLCVGSLIALTVTRR